MASSTSFPGSLNLPSLGRHVTRVCQSLSSLAPGDVKMRDPGNEVDDAIKFQVQDSSLLKVFQEIIYNERRLQIAN